MSIKVYNRKAEALAAYYESLSFVQVHADVLDILPEPGCAVLDVGAGSGRDAAWFAAAGYDVLAVEPAAGMLKIAQAAHMDPSIKWQQDSLPGLEKTQALGLSFDLVWLSAVWQHIVVGDRERALRKMVSLMRAGALMVVTLRHGTFEDGRDNFDVSVDELEKLARRHGMSVVRVVGRDDRLNRADISWQTVCLKLPDDGTEALPLLRHIILNDNKSSTYKLALLRILVRIADSAAGMARPTADDQVAIPLGLVALYWLRTYKVLIESNIPQMPATQREGAEVGLSFARGAFQRLRHLSVYDLRIGATFVGDDAANLRDALADAKNTIVKMPAYYIRYPNSTQQVFKPVALGRVLRGSNVVLNEQFLSCYGELHVPGDLWRAMSRFASWIEPSLLSEWVRLMQSYLEARGRKESYETLMLALTWLDPERDTTLVRAITQKMFVAQTPVYCVWSGKRLTVDSYDVDHCFPFAAWPCNDLWNLMPTNRVVNQKQKRDKLVTAEMLEKSRERMLEWWHGAYVDNRDYALGERFYSEARAALPVGELGVGDGKEAGGLIYQGMAFKRAALKKNLGLGDWEI